MSSLPSVSACITAFDIPWLSIDSSNDSSVPAFIFSDKSRTRSYCSVWRSGAAYLLDSRPACGTLTRASIICIAILHYLPNCSRLVQPKIVLAERVRHRSCSTNSQPQSFARIDLLTSSVCLEQAIHHLGCTNWLHRYTFQLSQVW